MLMGQPACQHRMSEVIGDFALPLKKLRDLFFFIRENARQYPKLLFFTYRIAYDPYILKSQVTSIFYFFLIVKGSSLTLTLIPNNSPLWGCYFYSYIVHAPKGQALFDEGHWMENLLCQFPYFFQVHIRSPLYFHLNYKKTFNN